MVKNLEAKLQDEESSFKAGAMTGPRSHPSGFSSLAIRPPQSRKKIREATLGIGIRQPTGVGDFMGFGRA